LPSALKTSRFAPGPNNGGAPIRTTPARQKAVSFDSKASPLALSASESTLQFQGSSASSIEKLCMQEFEQIPKYMKGRLTIEKINTMIDLLNQLYAEKYAIMHQNPNKLPHEVRQKYWVHFFGVYRKFAYIFLGLEGARM